MVEFATLPEDVLSHVFYLLDGWTVNQCKSVCAHWYNLISQLEKIPRFWRQLVLSEIGVDIATELSGKKFIDLSKSFEISEDVDWRSIYVKYKSAFRIGKSSPVIRKLNISGESHVSSFCPVEFGGGTGFITGHRDGHCMLWSDSESLVFNLVTEYNIRRPGDIKFIEVLNFPEKNGHNEVVVASLNYITRLVCLDDPFNAKYDTIFPTGNHIKCLRTFDSYLLVQQKNGVINVLKCSVDSSCGLTVIHLFSPVVGLSTSIEISCKWSTIWNDKIICVGYDLRREIYGINSKVRCSDLSAPVLIHYDGRHQFTEIFLDQINCFLFRNGINFVVNYGSLMISIDGRHFFELSSPRHIGSITSVDIHGGILALGTAIGNIIFCGMFIN
ncbi:hypothetical protein CHUAL_008704 [Chamberlinius hualienensis]